MEDEFLSLTVEAPPPCSFFCKYTSKERPDDTGNSVCSSHKSSKGSALAGFHGEGDDRVSS